MAKRDEIPHFVRNDGEREQKGRRFLASLEMTRGGEMSSSLAKKLSHMPLTNYTGQQ
jgi:hypothetical protein